MAAMGALGLGLLIAPAGIATADPAKSTTTSSSSRQAPDSLFPEVGSSRYNVKHYAIKLSYQTSGEIKAKTTVIAKTKKPLKSFSLDLEGLTVDAVKVNGHRADFSRRDNKLIIAPSKVLDAASPSLSSTTESRSHTLTPMGRRRAGSLPMTEPPRSVSQSER